MLTLEGCRNRQARFNARLEADQIAAALISAPRDIYYLTGLLPESPTGTVPSVLCLGPGLPVWLVSGQEGGEAAVDERVSFALSEMGTLNPDNQMRLCALVADRARVNQNLGRLGYQAESLPFQVARTFEDAASPREWEQVDEILQELQQYKDPDEICCIRRAIRATLAGYTRAQQVIRPGVREIEVMTECQAAAQRYTGAIHFFNGDFRSGELGGFARNRTIAAGEMYIIDAWSDVDGYWCDMSRTWIVGDHPSDLQAEVYAHIAGILEAVPHMARIGRSTRDLWSELDARIREHPHLAARGLIHHGGHGLGLRPHEPPDLNRDRGGVFAPGNVFTCEPGAYSDELRGGVRLENVFQVTEQGIEVLSPYPLDLHPDPQCPIP